MNKFLNSLWRNSPTFQLHQAWKSLRRSLTFELTITFYLMTSLITPAILTLGLIISYILGVGLGFDWYVDGLRSYYYDGEIFGMTGIPSWRGHLLWLFLCWLFSIIVQD